MSRARTPVIASSAGVVISAGYYECGGGTVIVRPDFRVVDPKTDSPTRITISYQHLVVREDLRHDMRVVPGEVIGHVAPGNADACSNPLSHVHLAVDPFPSAAHPINPHLLWSEGPGKVSCYRNGVALPEGKIVAPLRCQ